ncbi:uncharacterized protein LY89DRAFT_734932 [Mollisia scopiformis]|uniref:Uncharacterized protein n=1 Tax=Mollisia scopiformis TaxID=149040 RepID=A0A194X6I7_MOLSC|nr:uncharacterized protein LY89DRAFT_734932 [Mollisia scopiformis]KUJ15783.1 hypothetical protein LY89DRAFT_734932 [Mollisia scopiformis]
MKVPALDFSDVVPFPGFDVSSTLPFPYRPFRAGRYTMTMGIRKMPEDDWLVIDNLYLQEQELRRHLLRTNREGVLQCLPKAEEACKEALQAIVDFLTKRFPLHFQLPKDRPGYIHNAITDRTFRIAEPLQQHPLEIAAQLVMEDINLLMQGVGEHPNEYYLQASYSMAPAGWYIQERIGWPLWRIHHPVPMWNEKLRKPMEKFFLGLKVSSPVQRNNYFMQMDDTMFQQDPFPDSWPCPPKIEDIRIRHERQTLRRLPRTRAVMFMVRTYLTPVTDLVDEKDNLWAFREAIRAWPLEMAKYKGRHVWGKVFEDWCQEVLGDYVPSDDGDVERSRSLGAA